MFGPPQLLTVFSILAVSAHADNLHLIESRPSGFAIYRSGAPSPADFKHWCVLGIEEVYVLSGNAQAYEDKLADLCPRIKVMANEAQDVRIPPDERALALFDRWVQDAQAKNKKILFRCNCGCHRTGRLAAYYQMKYQNLSADDALALMNLHGSMMMFHPDLIRQVLDLAATLRNERSQRLGSAIKVRLAADPPSAASSLSAARAPARSTASRSPSTSRSSSSIEPCGLKVPCGL